jgi:hypothetical protein
MFYFFVRVGVNVLALWLTFMLLPGLTLDVDPQNELTPENVLVRIRDEGAETSPTDIPSPLPATTADAPGARPRRSL